MTTETPTELPPRLPELVDRANQFSDRFLITRHGHTEAVLLAIADFEGLLETVDILSDSACVQRLAEAEEELARGEGHSLDQVRRELPAATGSD